MYHQLSRLIFNQFVFSLKFHNVQSTIKITYNILLAISTGTALVFHNEDIDCCLK